MGTEFGKIGFPRTLLRNRLPSFFWKKSTHSLRLTGDYIQKQVRGMKPAAPLLLCLTPHTDDPGGDIDDPGGGSTCDWGSFSSFTTSASTLSKTPASYVSSSLTTNVSLLKSAADVVKYTDVDYATGSFCSS